MKKSQIVSFVSALVLIAVTIVLIAVSASVCAGAADTIHPMVYVMCIVAVITPFVCRPIIAWIERLEEEGK